VDLDDLGKVETLVEHIPTPLLLSGKLSAFLIVRLTSAVGETNVISSTMDGQGIDVVTNNTWNPGCVPSFVTVFIAILGTRGSSDLLKHSNSSMTPSKVPRLLLSVLL